MEDRVVEPVFTEDEYKVFNEIYSDFCYLNDNKNIPSNSDYFYRQDKLYENLVQFWPIIKSISQKLKIECEISLDEFHHIIYGLDRNTIGALYTSDRYLGIAPSKIIVLEEERLLDLARRFLNKIMVRLDRRYKAALRNVVEPDIEPNQTRFNKVSHVVPDEIKLSSEQIEAKEKCQLPISVESAYQSFAYSESKIGHQITDREAYVFLKEEGPRDYDLPAFETWQRYVRAGRKFHQTHKNTPRSGRCSRNIVQREDL
jgi:hypothetical protein